MPDVAGAAPPAQHAAAVLMDAQRQATTEALRLARQRKAEEAARLEAARAEAEHQAARHLAAEHQAAQRMAQERQAAQRLADERQAAQRQAAEQQAAQRLAAEREAQARREAEQRAAEQRAAEQRAAERARAQAGAASRAGAVPSASLPGPVAPGRAPLILVADDSKVVRVKTGRLLERQGWQVLLAEDGAAALQLLDSQQPDLLVTDVEMPGLDGFALTRQVRAHARLARLPVVMITSSDDRHRAEAAAAGVDLLLGKPYGEEALLAHLRRLLRLPAPRPEAALT
jgi:CheY-like chemotaxis protein